MNLPIVNLLRTALELFELTRCSLGHVLTSPIKQFRISLIRTSQSQYLFSSRVDFLKQLLYIFFFFCSDRGIFVYVVTRTFSSIIIIFVVVDFTFESSPRSKYINIYIHNLYLYNYIYSTDPNLPPHCSSN